MAAYMVLIQKNFPSATDDIYDYIQGALETGIDDFVTANDVYEEIGEILERLNDKKTEADIRDICGSIFSLLKPNHKTDNKLINGQIKKLNTPVDMNAPNDTNESLNAVQTIWMNKVEFPMQVDIKKLAKAKAKLEQKQVKREVANSLCTSQHKVPITKTATASQVTSKKEAKLESKGTNRSNDIRIENFDVAFGEKILLQNTDITLAFGRRYGLVGRNGLGKTTLLRMISSGQLRIPSHIRILHVEQEVVGNDTLALQSVLECDTELQKLIKREKEITAELNNDSTNVKLNAELSELYAKFESMDADKAIVKGSVILAGLGFTPEMQKKATKHFSGGWRMRLALARALFSRPDLLLLDEPTNMLDMKAIIWLESYLQTWPTTLLVVSHDRHFLDTVPTDILHFHSQRIDTYKGNYECFEKTRIDRLKSQQRELDAQIAQRAHIQEFIDKFRYNANRASSVQSKIKVLEKLPELKPIEKDSTVVLKFPDTDGLSPPIIQIDEMAFSYSSTTPLLSNVTLSANLDSRICIVGDNGTGKTTLLKLVMGALEPSKGTIYVHRNLKFGYFSQHHVDQLDMNVTCVDLLKATSPGKQIEEYRRILGSFGITGDLSLQFVGTLSGGQKSRVAFARMCLSSPNFLILDEPTNHLDIETIEALGTAINKYKGGVILVSHDERLIRKVCKELWVCGNGTVKSIEGGFEEYRMIVEKEIAESSK